MASQSTVKYECLRCDTVQTEHKSRGMKNMIIRCRGCGLAVYEVTQKTPAAEPKIKTCKTCGAKLRASNARNQCSACWGVR